MINLDCDCLPPKDHLDELTNIAHRLGGDAPDARTAKEYIKRWLAGYRRGYSDDGR